MARAATTKNQNSFINGVITDGNEFNAPENSARDMLNIEVGKDGVATRRRGLETTGGSQAFTTIGGSSLAKVNSVIWKGAGTTRNLELAAVQVGERLAVYLLSDVDVDNVYKAVLSLATVTGISKDTLGVENWKMVSGEAGSLYIVTSASRPVRVTYDETGPTLTGTVVDIRVRDTKGLDDGLVDDEEPTTLSNSHKYNLLNQGWTSDKITDYYNRVSVPDTWSATTSYSSFSNTRPTVLNGYYYLDGGSGTTGASEPTWPTSVGDTVVDGTVTWTCAGKALTYPSNSQQWFQGRNSTGDFSATELAKLDFGSAPVPRTRHVFDLYDITRSDYVTGATDNTLFDNTGFSTAVIYANRIFYLGFNREEIEDLSSSIYYSQLLGGESAHARCHSINDTSSEFFNEITAEDGGKLVVPALGNLHSAHVAGTSLIIFTTTGIWALNGGPGEVFKADSINIDKISDEVSLGESASIRVGDKIFCATRNGFYTISEGKDLQSFDVVNLAEGRYRNYYSTIIPTGWSVSTQPRVYHDDVNGFLHWSMSSIAIKMSVLTGAIFPYSYPSNTQDAYGVFSTSDLPGSKRPVFLLRSYASNAVTLSWGTHTATDFEDIAIGGGYQASTIPHILTWPEHVGVPHLRKQAIKLHTFFKRTEVNWISAGVFDSLSGAEVTTYWDWADDGVTSPKSTGPSDVYRLLRLPDDPGSGYPVALNYSPSLVINKTKVRGSGNSLQFKFEGKVGKDFQMIGWTVPIEVSTDS